MPIRIFILSHVLTPCFLRYHTLINYEYALTFIFVYSLVKEALRKNIFTLSENVFFFFMGGTEWRDYFNTGA